MSAVLYHALLYSFVVLTNYILPQRKNTTTVGNVTGKILSSTTVCFHSSFMYSGNEHPSLPFVTQQATLNIFVSFSCDISVLHVVLILQTDDYDNKDD